jgi:hypothetical protein
MTGIGRLALFTALLAAVFAAATAAGGAIDPDPAAEPPPDAAHESAAGGDRPARGGDDHAAGAAGGDRPARGGGDHAAGVAGAHDVRGLAVADGGLRLVVADRELPRRKAATLAFRVVDDRGRTVRDFDLEHERRMHLIVVRRDLAGFQHLHPRQTADGTWSTRVTLPAAGTYRVFADFTRAGEPYTLATDLHVDGRAAFAPLPAPETTAVSDGGYDVALDRDGAELRFTITRDGAPVRTQPYLGAGGHLVVLREGDLGFLHVHPASDRDVTFETTLPTPGRYRLFLQFRHDGRVHTVAFTEQAQG